MVAILAVLFHVRRRKHLCYTALKRKEENERYFLSVHVSAVFRLF